MTKLELYIIFSKEEVYEADLSDCNLTTNDAVRELVKLISIQPASTTNTTWRQSNEHVSN